MKKVLYLISTLKNNGPNKVLYSMINGIDENKYEVYILSFLNDNDLNYVNELKTKVKYIYLLNFDCKLDIILKGKEEVKKIVKEIKPDIIHSHGILPDIVNGKLKIKTKKITTIHDNMYEDYIYSFGKLKGNFFIKWHQHYLKRFNKCVCCSSSSYDVLKSHLKNTTYIRNAIYSNEINENDYLKKRNYIRKKYNIKENDIVYIYAGNLSKLKNVEDMVKSFNNSLNKNEYLFILGSGEMEEEIKSNIKNNHIIFVGFTKEVKDYMCSSDIYTSFSSSEGFSISVLEALETNNLLLLSDIPSHKEIFNIDKDLYIGEYFNKDNFKDKKQRVNINITNNVKNTKIFLEKYLNIKKMMLDYVKIYEEE